MVLMYSRECIIRNISNRDSDDREVPNRKNMITLNRVSKTCFTNIYDRVSYNSDGGGVRGKDFSSEQASDDGEHGFPSNFRNVTEISSRTSTLYRNDVPNL